ncbi:MAG TPA: competence/damage-inducible protein A [Myxococcota bacterium]|nr:competence/damage-inducible protein A [Myxococcota bacterium]
MSARDGVWVVTIGDELLRGEIVDSNKSHLSQRMLALELETARHVSVPDDPGMMEEVLREAAARARVVLVSGGLGPTRDDLTTEIAARTFGRKLVRDEESLEQIRAFFRRFNREMAANNAKQADFPEGATVLRNPIGTAPGFMLEVPHPAGEPTQLFFMPGVPRELYLMVDEQVVPRIAERLGARRVVRARLLRTFGIGESNLDRMLSDLAQGDADTVIGFRTQFPDNLVRILVRAPDARAAEARLDTLEAQVRARLGDLVVGVGERKLEEVVAELLRERKRTIGVAESITGGLIASRLTDVPGSSAYLLAGVIAYANDAKVKALGVSAESLASHGAVSEPVARQMAEGMRRAAGADIGLATTGIAGPDGGSSEKPVGTLWLALADGEGTIAHRYQLMTDRARNKELASQLALDWVRRRLLGLPISAETFPRLVSQEGRK